MYKENKDFILIESSDNVGGNILSTKKEGFILENGPNTVVLNNEAIVELIKDLKIWDRLIFPNKKIKKNRFVLLNNQLQLLPRNLFEFITSPLLKTAEKFRVILEIFVSKHKKNTTVASFIRRRFGDGILKQFIEPFVTGIYSGDVEKMSVKHTLKKIWHLEQKHGSVIKGVLKEKQKSHEIINFPNGLSELTDTIKFKIQNSIRTKTIIKSINKKNGHFEIDTGKTKIICKKIISTIPAHSLKKIIYDKKLCQYLNKIEYVPIDVFHFGFHKNSVKENAQGFGILTKKEDKKSYLGILFNSRIFHHVSPKDKELFTVIAGGSRQKKLLNMDMRQLKNNVQMEVMNLLKCSCLPCLTNHFRYIKGIPQYNMEHQKIIDEIKKFEIKNPNFLIIGNYVNGVSVSDCIKNSKMISKKI